MSATSPGSEFTNATNVTSTNLTLPPSPAGSPAPFALPTSDDVRIFAVVLCLLGVLLVIAFLAYLCCTHQRQKELLRSVTSDDGEEYFFNSQVLKAAQEAQRADAEMKRQRDALAKLKAEAERRREILSSVAARSGLAVSTEYVGAGGAKRSGLNNNNDGDDDDGGPNSREMMTANPLPRRPPTQQQQQLLLQEQHRLARQRRNSVLNRQQQLMQDRYGVAPENDGNDDDNLVVAGTAFHSALLQQQQQQQQQNASRPRGHNPFIVSGGAPAAVSSATAHHGDYAEEDL